MAEMSRENSTKSIFLSDQPHFYHSKLLVLLSSKISVKLPRFNTPTIEFRGKKTNLLIYLHRHVRPSNRDVQSLMNSLSSKNLNYLAVKKSVIVVFCDAKISATSP